MVFRGKQQVLIYAAAAAMLIAFVTLRYLPSRARAKNLSQIKTTQTLALDKAQAQAQRITVLNERLRKLEAAVSNFDCKIPSQRDVGNFLQQITQIMNTHNLKEQLIEPGKDAKSGPIGCIPINLQCKGTLNQMFEFFKSLQGLQRSVRVEQVKLAKVTDTNGQVSMTTRIVIFYRSSSGQG